jgi:hypothetical protein
VVAHGGLPGLGFPVPGWRQWPLPVFIDDSLSQQSNKSTVIDAQLRASCFPSCAGDCAAHEKPDPFS